MSATSRFASVGLRRQRLATRKGKQAMGVSAAARFAAPWAVAAYFSMSHVASLAEPRLHQLDRAHHARQKVVEVVGETACELAYGFHFLRLAQLLFRSLQRLGLLFFGGHVTAAGIDETLFRPRHPGDPSGAPVGMRDTWSRRLADLRRARAPGLRCSARW